MVFAGLYPADGEDYTRLRAALEKLKLNDASLTIEPENSGALGFGFRCGFLGLVHLEIVQERLEREYDLDLIVTAPSVAYEVLLTGGEVVRVDNPSLLPQPNAISEIREPILGVTIVTPSRTVGAIMELMHARRSEFRRMEYIQGIAGETGDGEGQSRVVMEYTMPLAEMLADFYNQLKSRTQGYASLDYTFEGYRAAPLVRIDILVNQTPVEALSMISHRDNAVAQGRSIVEKLRATIPRQMFEVPLQAAIGSRIVARETVPRHAQGRPRQVLRRRHHPQAQAAGKAEGRQEAHEARRPGGSPPGGVPEPAENRGRWLTERLPGAGLRTFRKIARRSRRVRPAGSITTLSKLTRRNPAISYRCITATGDWPCGESGAVL